MKTFINVDVQFMITYHCIDSFIKLQCKSHFIVEEIRTLLCSIKRGMEYLVMACKFFHNDYFYMKSNTKRTNQYDEVCMIYHCKPYFNIYKDMLLLW